MKFGPTCLLAILALCLASVCSGETSGRARSRYRGPLPSAFNRRRFGKSLLPSLRHTVVSNSLPVKDTEESASGEALTVAVDRVSARARTLSRGVLPHAGNPTAPETAEVESPVEAEVEAVSEVKPATRVSLSTLRQRTLSRAAAALQPKKEEKLDVAPVVSSNSRKESLFSAAALRQRSLSRAASSFWQRRSRQGRNRVLSSDSDESVETSTTEARVRSRSRDTTTTTTTTESASTTVEAETTVEAKAVESMEATTTSIDSEEAVEVTTEAVMSTTMSESEAGDNDEEGEELFKSSGNQTEMVAEADLSDRAMETSTVLVLEDDISADYDNSTGEGELLFDDIEEAEDNNSTNLSLLEKEELFLDIVTHGNDTATSLMADEADSVTEAAPIDLESNVHTEVSLSVETSQVSSHKTAVVSSTEAKADSNEAGEKESSGMMDEILADIEDPEVVESVKSARSINVLGGGYLNEDDVFIVLPVSVEGRR